MSVSLDGTMYAVVYSAVDNSARLLHDTHSLPSLCLWLTGRSRDWSVSRVIWGMRKQEHWPPALPEWCGVYNSVDYTTFILLKTQFCTRHRHVWVMRVCGVYAQKYGNITITLCFSLKSSYDLTTKYNLIVIDSVYKGVILCRIIICGQQHGWDGVKDEASFLWLSTLRTPFNALTLLHNRNSIWLVTTCFSYPQKFHFGDLVQHVATSE